MKYKTIYLIHQLLEILFISAIFGFAFSSLLVFFAVDLALTVAKFSAIAPFHKEIKNKFDSLR
jgi:uncharacterized membrane protein